MAVAVYVLSPVTILTTIPALLQLLTASGIPSFKGSLIPANPQTIRPFYKFSETYPFSNSYGFTSL
jgi:hypothetical protein